MSKRNERRSEGKDFLRIEWKDGQKTVVEMDINSAPRRAYYVPCKNCEHLNPLRANVCENCNQPVN